MVTNTRGNEHRYPPSTGSGPGAQLRGAWVARPPPPTNTRCPQVPHTNNHAYICNLLISARCVHTLRPHKKSCLTLCFKIWHTYLTVLCLCKWLFLPHPLQKWCFFFFFLLVSLFRRKKRIFFFF